MPIRALVVVASMAVGLALASSGTARAAATLTGVPDRAVAGLPVQVSGTCDTPPPSSRSTSQGVQVGLLRDGQPVVVAKAVPGTAPGTFTASLSVPADLAPGDATLASNCGGQAPFTVLAAPTVAVTPAQAAGGDRITVTGTCPATTGPATDLVLSGRRLAASTIDPATGEFGPTTLPVPSGTPSGRQVLSSSCGGTATLVVLTAAAATTTTGAATGLVTVPDLTGMTADQAAAVLGGNLVLGDVRGSGPRITGQQPAPGTQVRKGTPVAVVLAAATAGPPAFPVVAVVLGAAALLVLLAAAVVLLRARRLRRERRWLDEDVDVGVGGDGAPPTPPAGPDGSGPALEVRLVVVRQKPHGELQEAGHGPD